MLNLEIVYFPKNQFPAPQPMQQKKSTKRVFEPNGRLLVACRYGWLKVARALVEAGTPIDGTSTQVMIIGRL
jgi:hypothetical protein